MLLFCEKVKKRKREERCGEQGEIRAANKTVFGVFGIFIWPGSFDEICRIILDMCVYMLRRPIESERSE